MQLSALTTTLARFASELQRRKVIRVASLYVVGAWIVLQVAVALQSAIALSSQFSAAILALLVIGFPIAVALAWFFEITPEGVKRTSPAAGDGALVKPQTTDLILAGALLLVVIVAVAQWFIPQVTAPTAPTTTTTQTAPAKPEPPALGDKSIAVLPFANLSPDKENEYFADGLTEELLNLLAKIGDLKVISRTSSFAFKGKNVALPEIAKQLGVRHILEGSVRAQGDELRVTAQLIDVSTDTHLWTETYDRKIENVFALQDEIARAIAAALNIEVAVTSAGANAPTRSLEAYRLFLQGRESFRERSQAALEQGIVHLKQATALDPTFAEAYALLAASYYARTDFGSGRSRAEELALNGLARSAAQSALAHKPTLGLPHAVLSALHRRAFDWAAAIAAGKRAVASDPSDSTALLQLGLAELSVGNVEGAAEALAAARRVDPSYDHVRSWSIICESARGNEATAIKLAEALSQSPTGYARLAHLHLASHAYDRGDGVTAERHFRAFRAGRSPRPFVEAIVKALRNPAAKEAAVRALEAEAAASDRQPSFIPEYYLSMLGEHRLLMTYVMRRLDSENAEMVATLLNNIWQPRFKPLRQDPRFKAFLQRLGLVDYWKEHGWPDRCRAKGEDDFECS